jgi:hypothetical protein
MTGSDETELSGGEKSSVKDNTQTDNAAVVSVQGGGLLLHQHLMTKPSLPPRVIMMPLRFIIRKIFWQSLLMQMV